VTSPAAQASTPLSSDTQSDASLDRSFASDNEARSAERTGRDGRGEPSPGSPAGGARRGWSWVTLVLAAGVIAAMTAPGQTAGLSVFTDPLIAALGISRTDLSVSYLIGTLLGAAAQPLFGRALDRWGVRTVTVSTAVLFSAVLLALSFVGDVIGLTAGYVGVRMLGQGALTLAATTAIARSISHRRGLALGITSAIGSAGISLAPVVTERLIAVTGTAAGWRWEALAVAVVVVPLALVFPRRRAAQVEIGSPDEAPRPKTTPAVTPSAAPEWTLSEATRTAMFWVIAASLATSGMLGTGLAFHQIAILGEQGLSPLAAAANFLPQTVTGIVTTVLAGALVDRVSARIFIAFAMATLAAALVMLPVVTPGWTAIGYGLVLGAASGSLRGMEAASYVRYYGTRHIGTIRGVAMSINLASTALGPFALALGHDLTGTFTVPALALAAIPVVVLIAGLLVRPPQRPTPSGAAAPQSEKAGRDGAASRQEGGVA